MKLPQTSLISKVTCTIKDRAVHTYGPRKYLLFGPRPILHTQYLPGRAELSNAIIDFDSVKVSGVQKLPEVHFDSHKYCGVVPLVAIEANIWECSVDYVEAK